MKLYLNGFPKSGLHLATRFVLGMEMRPNNPDRNWLGTNPWTVERYNTETWLKNIVKLLPGQYIKGHASWDMDVEGSLMMLGIGCIFIYRDLRDVVVSQMHHIKNTDGVDIKHHGAHFYAGMTDEEIMLAIIEGTGDDEVFCDGIFDRFAIYAPWLDSGWALSLRYEEMIADYYRTANKILDYALYVTQVNTGEAVYLPDAQRHEIVRRMIAEAKNTKDSVTFRKGGSSWREEFTPAVAECFAEKDPGWLVELGYEKDKEWLSQMAI